MLAEGSESPGVIADVIEVLDFCLADVFGGLAHEIIDEIIHQTPDHEPPVARDVDGRAFVSRQILGADPERHLFQGCQREEVGVQAVVEVVARVGNLIGQVGDLRLERRRGIPPFGGRENVAVGVF
ncbi:MAG: hypothetical protein ACKOLA_07645, partial [Spartobacteria bacterium]